MPGKSSDDMYRASHLSKQTDDFTNRSQHLYHELCKIENLQLAYGRIKEGVPNAGIDLLALEAIEKEGSQKFIRELSGDLQARTYQPAGYSQQNPGQDVLERAETMAVRDRVVQVLLKELLDPIFQPDLPCDPEPEKVLEWIVGAIESGLGRAYVMDLEKCLEGRQKGQLVLEIAGRRTGDPDIASLLKKILEAPTPQDESQPGLLAPVLANIAYEGIDRMLRQAETLGREGTVSHVKCARLGHELIVLLDRDPRRDWMWPAVYSRLSAELSELKSDATASQIQLVDLARGGRLRFFGYELSAVTRRGRLRVHSKRVEKVGVQEVEKELPSQPSRDVLQVRDKRVEKPSSQELEEEPPSQPRQARRRPLEVTHRYLSRISLPRRFHFLGDAHRRVNSIKVGWQHLPITLYPILAIMYGWNSPLASVCAALILVCNWRRGLDFARYLRRRPASALVGVCGIAGLVSIWLMGSELYSNISKEVSVPAMPPSFRLGQYKEDVWGDATPVPYGLYVPPEFKEQKGPFPLVVFLHGYKHKMFKTGLSYSIHKQFGKESSNGPFQFVAFFPIDPTGKWKAGTAEVDDAMKALDYVIERHHIDPARIYLTGISVGGSGVWNLAEAYPNKWAALAPLASFYKPEVSKVRHLPTWIFHGAKDNLAPVEVQRDLAQELRQAKAEVLYTELPDKGHVIWREVTGQTPYKISMVNLVSSATPRSAPAAAAKDHVPHRR